MSKSSENQDINSQYNQLSAYQANSFKWRARCEPGGVSAYKAPHYLPAPMADVLKATLI